MTHEYLTGVQTRQKELSLFLICREILELTMLNSVSAHLLIATSAVALTIWVSIIVPSKEGLWNNTEGRREVDSKGDW